MIEANQNSDLVLISDLQFSHIENLLHTCTLPENEKELIRAELIEMTEERGAELIGKLYESQPFDAVKAASREYLRIKGEESRK